MGERIIATPAPVRDSLLIRGEEHLFRVGGGETKTAAAVEYSGDCAPAGSRGSMPAGASAASVALAQRPSPHRRADSPRRGYRQFNAVVRRE